MTVPPALSNPYIGPRPFAPEESHLFFGRDKEAKGLLHLVIAERLVLFYAQSGAGKSSLINARLIPGLQEFGYCVLPIGRASGQRAATANVNNPFVYNLLLSLHNKNIQSAIEDSELIRTTLPEYLARLVIDETGPVGLGAGVRPLVLIIDQFEEIFTTHLEEWEKRTGFFEQLRQAQEADPYLWVVLAMREDFVARLDPYKHQLNGLRHRFYMERMSYDAALEAVKRPVELLSRPFEAGVAEELVNNLRRIAPAEDSGSQPRYGQYIDPVQLQVVCYQLWEQLIGEAGETITKEDLTRLAKGEDMVQFISSALADFYKQAIDSVMQAMPDIPEPQRVTERKLRDWFSNQLITKAETCNLVFKDKQDTGGMPNAIVDLLAAKFIIHPENRGTGTWYQLSHDRLVNPILEANRAWGQRNPRPIQADTEAWLASKKSPDLLYEGRQLEAALPLLDGPHADLSETERDFIHASQTAANRRQARRSRFIIVIFLLVALMLAGLAAYSLYQKDIAEKARGLADQQRQTAEAASIQEGQQRRTAEAANVQEAKQRQTAVAAANTAEAASVREIQQRQTAEAASALAQQQAEEAEKARAEAQAANLQAQASRLSSLSDYFRTANLKLSLLLAVESFKISNSLESRRAMLNSIQSGITNRVTRAGAPWYLETRPHSAVFSPDGSRVAVGTNGRVYLWNIKSGEPISGLPTEFQKVYSMFSVAFDGTGTLLARGGGDGKLVIWNQQTSDVQIFRPFNNFRYSSILSIAFQPGGNRVAVSTEIHPDTGKGQVYLYNYKDRKQETAYTYNCGEYDCVKVAWSPDGSRLAIASKSGQLQIIDVIKNESLWLVPRAHDSEISGLAWYPDGRRLVTSGYDQRLIQWDIDAQKIIRQVSFPRQSFPVNLTLSPDGRFLLAGINNDIGNWFGLWNAETLQKQDFILSGHTRAVTAVAFSAQGNQFVTAGFDNRVNLWNFEPVDSPGVVLQITAGSQVEAVGTDSTGRLVLARNAGSALLDVITEEADKPVTLQAPHAGLAYVQLDGPPAIALGDVTDQKGKVSFIDPVSGKDLRDPVSISDQRVGSLAVSADGRLLATASCPTADICDQLALHDLKTGQPLPLPVDPNQLGLKNITSLAFSLDGKMLAVGDTTGKIILHDIDTGENRPVVTEGLQNVTIPVTSLAFSPVEQGLLIAGFKDGRIALWDAGSREPVGEFVERMNSAVTGLLVRKNSASGLWTLVSASSQGEVREWEIDPTAWVARACQIAGRKLSEEEIKKFLPPSLTASTQMDACPAK